jgi:hypothetical protein
MRRTKDIMNHWSITFPAELLAATLWVTALRTSGTKRLNRITSAIPSHTPPFITENLPVNLAA